MDDQPASLASALADLQQHLPAVAKEADAQYGKYADLTAVSAAILPLMGERGLSFSAKATMRKGEFGLVYKLRHAPSGEADKGFWPLPKGTPQQVASAITYFRRYLLCALTGVAPGGEDDDGQAASEAKPARQQRQALPVRQGSRLPRTADGSVSRSATTDDEKNAAGLMTDAQQKEHTALRKGAATGRVNGAERGPLPDEDNQWQAELTGEQRPGSAIGEQTRDIGMSFAALGCHDRGERLLIVERIIGHELTGPNDGRTSSNLSYTDAEKVKRRLSEWDSGDLAAFRAGEVVST